MNEITQLTTLEEAIARNSYNYGWNDAVNTIEEALKVMDKKTQVRDLLGVFHLLIKKEQYEQED